MDFSFAYYVTVVFSVVFCLCESRRYEVRLDDKFVFGWEVDMDNKSICLDATVETIGYVGMGISTKGKMDGADMAMGGVRDSGKTYYGIYHGKHHKPVLDRKQNWNLLAASENSTHTFVKYTRLLDTGDSQNVPITDDDTHIIWAIGKSDELKKHHGHGKYTVNLINPSIEINQQTEFESSNDETRNSRSFKENFRSYASLFLQLYQLM